jgi:hypothetical protein
MACLGERLHHGQSPRQKAVGYQVIEYEDGTPAESPLFEIMRQD